MVHRLAGLLFSFRGRIARDQFWARFLGTVGTFVLAILVANGVGEQHPYLKEGNWKMLFVPIGIVAWLAFFWILLTIHVRRLHDLDCGAIFLLIHLVPIIGPIVALIVLGSVKGTSGPNRYGPDPVGSTNAVANAEV